MKRRVAWFTTARSDYGPSYWVLRDLLDDARFELALVVGGAHLDEAAGHTVREIEADGIPIAARLAASPGPLASGARAGAVLAACADLLEQMRPAIAVVYGDRHELLSIATATVLTRTPMAHLCGGDVTGGALDEQVRHALTKIAHVHFPSNEVGAARILRMGEEPWRVHAVGDPALDHFTRGTRASLEEIAQRLGFTPDTTSLLVTLHPETAVGAGARSGASELASALREHVGHVVITGPAPDPGHEQVRAVLQDLAQSRPMTSYVESLGSRLYRGLMHNVGALVGNSSSGLNEAPCVPVPAVNIGTRQQGRERGANVIDCPSDRGAIAGALRRALAPEFRASLRGMASPYGDGRSARRVLEVLASLPERERLLHKGFTGSSVSLEPSAASRTPLGGDFGVALETLASAGGREPLFATARGALAAIVRRHSGRDGVWLVPDFICGLLPSAVRRAGARVVPYPWLTPWRVDQASLTARLGAADGIVVPFYLGLPPGAELWDAIGSAGLCVVEDRCQCVGPPPEPARLQGDYAIGSFRKWLGVPDGAYCVSRTADPPRPSAGGDASMARLRLVASIAKEARGRGGSEAVEQVLERASVELFRLGEERADASGERAASPVSLALLHRADIEAVRRARLRNQSWLVERLVGVPGLSLLDEATAAARSGSAPMLALPVACADREATWNRLAAAGIYCAVHWRDGDWSEAGGLPREWARTLLSLPIDHRYDLEQLSRIPEALA